jgi:hypothetical protein
MIPAPFQFQRVLPAATLAAIVRLQADGYVIHKELINGIELRKGKLFRDWLLALQVIFPVLLFPGYMRSVIDNLYGYKHRVLVTLDAVEPQVLFV